MKIVVVLFGFLAGALLGAFSQMSPSSAEECDFLTNTHSTSGSTCSGHWYDWYSVDYLKNTGDDELATACIEMETLVNIDEDSVEYAPAQCVGLASQSEQQFTLLGNREDKDYNGFFKTASAISGSASCHQHNHEIDACGP